MPAHLNQNRTSLALTRLEDRVVPAILADGFEPHGDTRDDAVYLWNGEGLYDNLSIHHAGDVDWYRTVAPPITTGRFDNSANRLYGIRVEHNATVGALDVQAFATYTTTTNGDGLGDRLGTPVVRGNTIELTFGTALQVSRSDHVSIRIMGVDGATVPSYSIEPLYTNQGFYFSDRDDTAAESHPLPDRPENITLRNLAETDGQFQLNSDSDRSDWYEFNLGSTGRAGDQVRVTRNGSAATDAKAELYAAGTAPTLIASGNTLSLEGRTAGNYFLRVFDDGSGTNSNYVIDLVRPPSPAQDRFEPNDSISTATNLGTIIGSRNEEGLSITPADEDYYRFRLADVGRPESRIQLQFTDAAGDIDAVLLDANGAPVRSASSSTDNEEILLEGLPGGRVHSPGVWVRGCIQPGLRTDYRWHAGST